MPHVTDALVVGSDQSGVEDSRQLLVVSYCQASLYLVNTVQKEQRHPRSRRQALTPSRLAVYVNSRVTTSLFIPLKYGPIGTGDTSHRVLLLKKSASGGTDPELRKQAGPIGKELTPWRFRQEWIALLRVRRC